MQATLKNLGGDTKWKKKLIWLAKIQANEIVQKKNTEKSGYGVHRRIATDKKKARVRRKLLALKTKTHTKPWCIR